MSSLLRICKDWSIVPIKYSAHFQLFTHIALHYCTSILHNIAQFCMHIAQNSSFYEPQYNTLIYIVAQYTLFQRICRTGTLIALYKMKHHGFTAQEAMGWLRIVRPRSVIGEQQDFLCAREAVMMRSAAPLRPAGVEALAGDGVEEVQRLIDDTVRAYDERYAVALAAQERAGAAGRRRSESVGSDGGGAGLAEHVAAAAERRAAVRSRIPSMSE